MNTEFNWKARTLKNVMVQERQLIASSLLGIHTEKKSLTGLSFIIMYKFGYSTVMANTHNRHNVKLFLLSLETLPML